MRGDLHLWSPQDSPYLHDGYSSPEFGATLPYFIYITNGTNSMWFLPWSVSGLLGDRTERSVRGHNIQPWSWAWGRQCIPQTPTQWLHSLRLESLSQIHFSAKYWLVCHNRLRNGCCKGKIHKTCLCLRIPAHINLMWRWVWKYCTHSASTVSWSWT